jgi:hypothetical protein
MKLICAQLREKNKLKKYIHVAQRENLTFIPLVMESTGAFGRHFKKIIRSLAKQASDQRIMSERDFYVYACSSICFSLHRGNGFVISKFVSHCRTHTRTSSIQVDSIESNLS